MTSSTSKKIFTVVGATGQQGGSVIAAILQDEHASAEFALRGITRDASKPAAQALASKGVQVVTGDIGDKASLQKAFDGSHTVFAVTNYWDTLSAETELQQGRSIADAAKAAGVQHLIFSTLYNVKQLSGGKYPNVYHFDAKAEVAEYIRSLAIPASFYLPGFYMSNFDGMFLHPDEHGVLTLALPNPGSTPIPCIDASRDTGKFVKAMALHRDDVLGKNVLGAAAYYTIDDFISTFRRIKPATKIQFFTIDEQTFKSKGLGQMPPHVQQEMYENMVFMDEFGYYGKEKLDWSLSLLTPEKATTLAEYIAQSDKLAQYK